MSPSIVLYDPYIVTVLYTISTAGLTSQTRSSTPRNKSAPLCKKSDNFTTTLLFKCEVINCNMGSNGRS